MRFAFVLAFCILGSCCASSQQADSLPGRAPDSCPLRVRHDGAVRAAIADVFVAPGKINVPRYIVLLGRDFRLAFSAPVHMKRADWLTVGKFAVVAGSLAFFDETVQRSAARLTCNKPVAQAISHQVTNFGAQYETYALAGLGAYSFLFKKQRMKNTVLLTSQAYITSVALGKVVKFLTNRQRPFGDSLQLDIEPTFHGPFYKTSVTGSPKRTNSSFPSGHTTVAFAAATVFAMEYRDKPLVPIIAYSAASLVGLSRLTENKHWATDVITGAALGYLSGRLVVNNFHRLTNSKPRQTKNAAVHFNLGYSRGAVVAGFFYNFR